MKSTRKWATMLFTLLMCVCFVSVPVLSDGGDEDPWDADDTGGGGTNGGDLGDVGDNPFDDTSRLLDSDGYGIFDTPALLSGFWIPVSLQLYDYFYEEKVQLSKSYLQKDKSTNFVLRNSRISDAR